MFKHTKQKQNRELVATMAAMFVAASRVHPDTRELTIAEAIAQANYLLKRIDGTALDGEGAEDE